MNLNLTIDTLTNENKQEIDIIPEYYCYICKNCEYTFYLETKNDDIHVFCSKDCRSSWVIKKCINKHNKSIKL